MGNNISITDRLNQAFNRSGLSQAELARACGLMRGAVNGWLRGRSVNIRPEHLFAVADALQIEARWLATGMGPMARRVLGASTQALVDNYASLRDDEKRAVELLVNQIADKRENYET